MTTMDQSPLLSPQTSKSYSSTSSHLSSDDLCYSNNDMLGFTSNLLSTLTKTRTHVDTFVNRTKNKIEEICESHAQLIQKEQDEINEMISKLNKLKYQRGVKDQSVDECNGNTIPDEMLLLNEQILETEKELANLYIDQKQKKEMLQEAEEKENFHQIKAEEAREAKRRVEEAKRTTIEDLSFGVLKYKKLGLNFEKVADNQLRFVYTFIDPKHPKRKFSCVLGVNDDDMYELLDCNPSLPLNQVAKYLHHLNEFSDVSQFVRSMRKEFKESLRAKE